MEALAEQTAFAAINDWCGSSHAQIVALESTWYMRNQLLRDADWASMAHSLEVRVPFVDRTLLETLAPLIAGKNPPGKSDMLAPFQSQLPGSIAARGKTGFGTPVQRWLAEVRPDAAAGKHPSHRRGLRPWAMHVYEHFLQHV
jgi:asparagine synthase (glutamine-hydrolysing)